MFDRIFLFPVFLLMATGLAAQATFMPKYLLQESFDKDGSGFRKRALRSPQIELAEGAGKDGSNAIRVAYVGNERGSQRVVFRYPLRRKVTQATLSFEVKFEKDFQWTAGGKLHGLGPAKPVSGGGKRVPEGWSARMMFKEEGKISTYLYDQDQSKKWGVGDKSAHPVFKAGQWHQVVMQLQLNDPGQANGAARILIDGKEILKTGGVTFRGKGGEETLIRNFMFSTFHGGSQPKWTPVDAQGNPTTVHALYDNFRVFEGFVAPPE